MGIEMDDVKVYSWSAVLEIVPYYVLKNISARKLDSQPNGSAYIFDLCIRPLNQMSSMDQKRNEMTQVLAKYMHNHLWNIFWYNSVVYVLCKYQLIDKIYLAMFHI